MHDLTALPAALRADTARLLERFDEAVAAAALTLPNGPLAAHITSAFAKSPFLAEYACRAPAEFLTMIAAADTPRDRNAYDALLEPALDAAPDVPAAKQALRRRRRAEMARIAWRDLEGRAPVETVMAELSAFADATVSAAVAWLHQRLEARFGRAYGEDGAPLSLLVLGMGKLGGGELNYSSDIDLLFIYECDGVTRGGRKELEHQDYFDRLGRELIGLLNENTADGFVFRVDMRLRPFGDSGPLTSSLAAIEHYYAVHGRDWERYALIKARPLCGDERCRVALEALIRPFVYRRYLDYGALDALRDMKALIDREASSEELAGDVKRGRGGIREIEFTGQLFQLTRGGREARLRQRSLLPTLEVCGELGLLDLDEVRTLLAAYRFLRTVEHRLQQVRDEQTHALPREPREQARLAFALDYADWPALAQTLDAHRAATRALFAGMLQPVATQAASARDADDWTTLWRDAAHDDLGPRLVARGRADPTALVEALRDLKSERFQARLSQHSRARLDRVMPRLLELFCTRGEADETVLRLAGLLRAIAGRSVYLAFLADNPDALTRVVDLFAASSWIAQQITRHPLLLDELLDARALYAPPDQARLHALLGAQLAGTDDLESAMETLRAFKNSQVLRVAASDITGQFPIAEVSNQLTYIAEVCVGYALDLAWRDLVTKYGTPRCADGAVLREVQVAVIGYGKLGGWELGYGSDLDLVFLHDSAGEAQRTDGERPIENPVFLGRLAQRLVHILSTTTPSGMAYEIDTRLRPSGAAGQLVTNAEAFATYQDKDAWVWEHQALVRARAIAGAPALCARFGEIRAQVLARPRAPDQLARDIAEMRARMLAELDRGGRQAFDLKHGRGGITDIEFMVQYAVLRWAGQHPRLLTWTDNLRLLEIIADLGLWSAAQCRGLHDAYFAYRAELHRCALQQIDGLVDASRFQEQRREVRAIWDAVLGLHTHAGENT